PSASTSVRRCLSCCPFQPPPPSPPFPYTTLFRSRQRQDPFGRERDLAAWQAQRPARLGLRQQLRSARAPTRDRPAAIARRGAAGDRKSTRLNSSHVKISYAVFCLKKKRRRAGAGA